MPNDLVVLVQKDRAVHLTTQPDRAHVGALELGLLDHRANRFHGCFPPILRILFGPTWAWLMQGILSIGLGQHLPRFVDQQCFRATGPNVNSQVMTHVVFW